MDQILGIFGIEWKILLVNFFNFTVLLIVLTYLLYKPVIKLLDERRAKVEKTIKDAKEAEEKLSQIKETEKKVISEAQRKAQDTIDSAQAEAKKEHEEIVREAQAKALTTVAMAKRQAEEEKANILKEAKEQIAKEAVLAAKKIIESS